jgi:hypothetical protein
MGIKRRLLFAAFLVVLVLGLVWLVCYLRRPPDPVYHGKPLSAWLRQEMQANQIVIEEHVQPGGTRHVPAKTHADLRAFDLLLKEKGPEILPFLIADLKTGDNLLWAPYESVRRHLPRFIGQRIPPWPEPVLVRSWAAYIIKSMGPAAAPAVPVLCERIVNEKDPRPRRAAMLALYDIGPAAKGAVPTLLITLEKDPSSEIRGLAAFVLGPIHPEAQTVLPALTKALQDPDVIVRTFAAQTLGQYGSDARPAVEPLHKLASGTMPVAFTSANSINTWAGQDVLSARNALKKIEITPK